MTGADVVSAARAWVGVPFRHQGRSRTGVDCAGLIVCLARDLGVLPAAFDDPRDYPRAPRRDMVELLERYAVRGDPGEGALALIQWPRERWPRHIAVLTPDTMIHAYERRGRVLEHGYRGQWVRWTHSTWRVPGVVA